MSLLWLAVALLGHVALAVGTINRLHSRPLPRWMLEVCDILWYVWILAGGLILARFLPAWTTPLWIGPWDPWRGAVSAYAAVCAVSLVVAVATRPGLLRGLSASPGRLAHAVRVVDLRTSGGDSSATLPRTLPARVLAALPANEIFRLHIEDESLHCPRLPPEWDRFTIAHLSDLHLTGQLSQAFYRHVVELTNELHARMIVVTGDIVEHRACLDWLPETLGRLEAAEGVYFVLGNHDERIHDTPRVRRCLRELGWHDLGSNTARLAPHGGTKSGGIVLAGNELPWHPPAAEFPPSDGPRNESRDFRILLAHSPDQFAWGRRNDVDLVLAGHTHGGQIQLPIWGPLFSPSWYGVRYTAGVFRTPPTLMHVSRGLAGTRPIRWRCPPEITRLTLVRDEL